MKNLSLAIAALLLVACGEDTSKSAHTTDTTPTVNEPVVELPKERNYDQEIQDYIAEKGWEAKATGSGLYVVTEKAGGEEKPQLSQAVTIYYNGYLLDGTVFDHTDDGQPATFGLNRLIAGWQEGIPYFGKGGNGKLIVPPSLGYGDFDSGPSPGKSILVFDIELIDFK